MNQSLHSDSFWIKQGLIQPTDSVKLISKNSDNSALEIKDQPNDFLMNQMIVKSSDVYTTHPTHPIIPSIASVQSTMLNGNIPNDYNSQLTYNSMQFNHNNTNHLPKIMEHYNTQCYPNEIDPNLYISNIPTSSNELPPNTDPNVLLKLLQQQQQMPAQEDFYLWFYLDPRKNIQGPFHDSQMFQWWSQGIYFQNSLLMKRKCDADFSTLQDYSKRFSGVPFNRKDIYVPALTKTLSGLHQNNNVLSGTMGNAPFVVNAATGPDFGMSVNRQMGNFPVNNQISTNHPSPDNLIMKLLSQNNVVGSNSSIVNSTTIPSSISTITNSNDDDMNKLFNKLRGLDPFSSCSTVPVTSSSVSLSVAGSNSSATIANGLVTSSTGATSGNDDRDMMISGHNNNQWSTNLWSKASPSSTSSVGPTSGINHQSWANQITVGIANTHDTNLPSVNDVHSVGLIGINSSPAASPQPNSVLAQSDVYNPTNIGSGSTSSSWDSLIDPAIIKIGRNVSDNLAMTPHQSTINYPLNSQQSSQQNVWAELVRNKPTSQQHHNSLDPLATTNTPANPTLSSSHVPSSCHIPLPIGTLPSNSSMNCTASGSISQEQPTAMKSNEEMDRKRSNSCDKEITSLISWCKSYLENKPAFKHVDISTLVELLIAIESPYEVDAMLNENVPNFDQSSDFVREFLERRRPVRQKLLRNGGEGNLVVTASGSSPNSEGSTYITQKQSQSHNRTVAESSNSPEQNSKSLHHQQHQHQLHHNQQQQLQPSHHNNTTTNINSSMGNATISPTNNSTSINSSANNKWLVKSRNTLNNSNKRNKNKASNGPEHNNNNAKHNNSSITNSNRSSNKSKHHNQDSQYSYY